MLIPLMANPPGLCPHGTGATSGRNAKARRGMTCEAALACSPQRPPKDVRREAKQGISGTCHSLHEGHMCRRRQQQAQRTLDWRGALQQQPRAADELACDQMSGKGHDPSLRPCLVVPTRGRHRRVKAEAPHDGLDDGVGWRV
jgi:hypothetical protein